MLGKAVFALTLTIASLSAFGQTGAKPTLICFQGSDWCIPCIRMEKAILEQPGFTQFADSSLHIIKADFPRLSKNKLAKDVKARNEQLADQYNAKGVFPMLVLIDENGRVIHTWEGEVKASPEDFVNELRRYLHQS